MQRAVVSNALPIPTNSINTSTNYAAPVILSQYSLTYFTNHTFLVQPITCGTATPAAGFYQGVEKMQFVRADFDSLHGPDLPAGHEQLFDGAG